MNKLTTEVFDAYVELLRQHDWHYDHSDDHRMWRKGSAERSVIILKATPYSILVKVYRIWANYVHSELPREDAKRFRDWNINILREQVVKEESQ